MRLYSQDLREKVIRALEVGETQEEVADRFSVSLSFIEALCPTLSAGDIVVMDNLRAHKVAGVAEAIEERGAG
jgi:transposase